MPINLTEENKVNILLSALDEKNNSLRVIRERVQNIGIWFLGIVLGAGGWFIQSEIEFSFFQKLYYLSGALISFFVIKNIYLKDLKKGFKGQQKVIVKIEDSLSLYTPKIFNDKEDSLYPDSWKKAGTDSGDGKFFDATNKIICMAIIFLILIILFK